MTAGTAEGCEPSGRWAEGSGTAARGTLDVKGGTKYQGCGRHKLLGEVERETECRGRCNGGMAKMWGGSLGYPSSVAKDVVENCKYRRESSIIRKLRNLSLIPLPFKAHKSAS